MLTQVQEQTLASMKAELASGVDKNGKMFSADYYYGLKHNIRKLEAKKRDMTAMQYDPVGTWFDMQSN